MKEEETVKTLLTNVISKKKIFCYQVDILYPYELQYSLDIYDIKSKLESYKRENKRLVTE